MATNPIPQPSVLNFNFEFVQLPPGWCIINPQSSNVHKDSTFSDDGFQTLGLVENETLQRYIDARSRAHIVDWLVSAAEGLRYTPQTLHLTINCLDRYLSLNAIECDELEFIGLTCMMVASKYEELQSNTLDLDAYLNLMTNTCSRSDFIRMEQTVLTSLDYGLTVPTTWTFLEMLVNTKSSKSTDLECVAGYVADVSLVSYGMLRFAPSMVAASSVFLARYVLDPFTSPWDFAFQKYTKYGAADLRDCVLELLSSCHSSKTLPSITNKYKQVALMNFPPSIPQEVFYS